MRHPISNKKKSWFRSPIIAILLIIFIGLGVLSAVRAYAKVREALALRNETARELDQINEKKSEISTKIENLSSDRGLESEVRDRYRVVKPGEHMVIVVDNSDGETLSQDKRSFWISLRAFIGF